MTNIDAIKIGLYWTSVAKNNARALYRINIEKGMYGTADNFHKEWKEAEKAEELLEQYIANKVN